MISRHLVVGALALLFACSSSAPKPARSMADVSFGLDVSAAEADLLRGAATLELLALEPDGPLPEQRNDPTCFHGYRVLGRALVSDVATRTQLLDAIGRACRENDGRSAACFAPRHGVRAITEGHTVDLLICFQCLSMRVYADGVSRDSGDLASTQEPEVSGIFRAQGLSIAP
ncbi:MAG: hypothetical protein R3F49_23800 [Planctomycetota bacterium]